MTKETTYTLQNVESFTVSGIAIRTTNHNAIATEEIGDLWGKFMNENIHGQITNRLNDDIYCVYTDYESDHTGYYTALIGFKVDEPSVLPGMYSAYIPAGTYRMYKPEGKLPDSIGDTWMDIWEDGGGRNYIADYDVYKAGAKSFEDTESAVFVGIK